MPRPHINETRTHCQWGHPWIPGNVYNYPYGTCRTCRRHYKDPRVIALKEKITEYKSALAIATRHHRDTSEIEVKYENALWQVKDLYPPYFGGQARHPLSDKEILPTQPIYVLTCQGYHCGKEFEHPIKTAQFCSSKCRYESTPQGYGARKNRQVTK